MKLHPDEKARGLSLVMGPQVPPLIEATIGGALASTVAEVGDSIALIVRDQGVRWTWRELDAQTDRLATGLLKLGLIAGDRVGIWAPNCAEWVVTQLATAKIGLILVNINPAYRAIEVEHSLTKAGCRALITAPRFKSSDYIGILNSLGISKLPQVEFLINLGEDFYPGFDRFADLCVEGDADRVRAAGATLEANDPINIQFTSGTTGSPKGATLTHRNILNNGFFVGRQIGLTPADRLCIPVPLYHCFGMVMGNLACLTHGASMVYPSEAFDPLAVLQTVQEEKCTALYGVPTMFIAMLNHPNFPDFDLSSLRTGIMAGSSCPETTMREVMERMNMSEVTIAYGMTETSPVSFQTERDDPFIERISSVGRVHPHVEAKIVADDGSLVPRGVTGELCTRGYSIMQGYWDDPERTLDALDDDGWMHTGDLATIDEAGFCRITGRNKDMLIRGGENIYPREIEDFLMRHPAIADVQVVGVPDERFGEEICACVILKPGQQMTLDEVKGFCRDQIAHFKIPRFVLFVDTFPMTVTGKVQKYVLREWAAGQI